MVDDASCLGEEHYRLLVDSVEDFAIVMLDLRGRIATWNQGAQRLLGYTQAEIVGHSMECCHSAEAVAAGKPAQLLAIAAAGGRCEDEGWRIRKDGTRFYANALLTAMRDAAGALVGFAEVTRNISKRRQVEKTLRASESRYRLLAENTTDVIMLVAPDFSQRLYVSPSCRDLFGYEPEELLRDPVGRLVHPDDRGAWAEARARSPRLLEDEAMQATYRVVRKDGTAVWVESSRRRLPNNLGYVVSIRDITARKQAEDELREAKLRAEHATEARVAFFNEMSHELRTPLNAVIGFASFMEEQVVGPIGNPRYLEAATDIRASGEHLLALINDVLNHAKAEAGYLELEEDAVSIADVIAFVAHLIGPRAASGGVTLTTAIGAEAHAVRGDERRLRQILLNLATNAVKFTPVGGQVAITTALNAAGELLISVADTGFGIAEADRERIFEPFSQVKTAWPKAAEGTGLGLPLTKRLVELHGGAIDIDSMLGAGTTITVRLPAARLVPGPLAQAG